MKKISKKLYISLVLIILTVSLIYVCNIYNLPERIVLFEGEKLNLRTITGVKVDTSFSSNPNIERIENKKTATVSTNAETEEMTGRLNLKVSLLGFKVKDIDVDIIKNAEVVPLRKSHRSKTLY